MACFNRLEQVISGVVDTLNDIGIALGIGSPKDNDFVKLVGSLEVTGKNNR